MCYYSYCVHGEIVYTEKATNTRLRQGTQKTNNTHNHSKRPSIGTTQRLSTGHHQKSSPRVKLYKTNQHSNRARLQHSNRARLQHSNL